MFRQLHISLINLCVTNTMQVPSSGAKMPVGKVRSTVRQARIHGMVPMDELIKLVVKGSEL